MSGPDSASQAALRSYGTPIIPIYIGFLDIVGDPIRVTTAPYNLVFPPGSTGDQDLDGFTFSAVDPTLISVGSITAKEGGGDTVTCTLSGLIGVDTDLLNQIGNKDNWQDRVARLWQLQMNADLTHVGAIWPFYTGFMTVPKIVGDNSTQTIQLDIEGFISFYSAPSSRSYLSQQDFDSGDLSAAASISCANGQNGVGAAVAAASAASVYGYRGSTGRPAFL